MVRYSQLLFVAHSCSATAASQCNNQVPLVVSQNWPKPIVNKSFCLCSAAYIAFTPSTTSDPTRDVDVIFIIIITVILMILLFLVFLPAIVIVGKGTQNRCIFMSLIITNF